MCIDVLHPYLLLSSQEDNYNVITIKNNSHGDYHYDNVRANVSMTLSHLPL